MRIEAALRIGPRRSLEGRMAKSASSESKPRRGMSIAARLAILALVTTACYGGILAISSRGFARLNGAVVQVNRIQGGYVLSANALLSQCNALELFVLAHAMRASAGEKEVGSSSRPPLEAISNAARAAASGLEGLASSKAIDEARTVVLLSFNDYMATLTSLPDDLDAGGSRLAGRVDSVQNSFLILSNRMYILLAALREVGDRAASDASRLTTSTSFGLSAVIVGAILFCVAISIFIIRSITSPLGGLVAEVKRIGDGDLTAKMSLASSDELGKIAAGVDGLILDLRSLVGGAKEKLALLEETGQNLSAMMTQTGAAVVEINSNIASTGAQLREQTAAVAEATTAIEDLTRGVDALEAMIDSQSEVIAHSSAAVEEMIANTESVAANVSAAVDASSILVAEGGEGRARIEAMGESVAAIVRYSENLGEAAGLITQVAERTNILAMNAAIEAAHAGDSGKGFAVVADEIRKLAEQSSSQSKDIAADLSRVAEAIDAVRAASAASALSFTSILGKSGTLGDEVRAIGSSMTEQREGGKQVLEGLSRLRDITREIQRGSGEMSGGNVSILEQIKKLIGVNAAVVGNNAEMTSGTAEINQAIAGTIDLSSRNAQLISELRDELDKFRI